MQPYTSPADSKVCSTCGRRLPIDQFDRYRTGGESRRGQCRRCRSPQRKKQLAQREFLGQACWRLTRAEDHCRVELICREMVHRIGGIAGLTEFWHEALVNAKPGSRAQVNLVLGLSYMVAIHGNELERLKLEHQDELSQLSDEELEERQKASTEALAKEVMKLVRPQMAAEIEAALADSQST